MLTEEVNPLNHVKSYKYDGNGNLVTMTDEDGITAKYEYDAVNNLIKTEYNGELNAEYSYNILWSMKNYLSTFNAFSLCVNVS